MIIALLKKEFSLEIRRKAVISGLVIYLLSTVFIGYMAFGFRVIDPISWSALFWITLLFTAVNIISKGFVGESKGREIYYYSVANPSAIIVSKIVYGFLICSALSFFGFLLFAVFFSHPIEDIWLFILLIILVSFGFSASLSLLSSIASKATNSGILMAVLSFPVIISILLLAIKVTKNCIDGLDRSASFDELLTLVAINCLVSATSYLLFPYIWRS